MNPSDAGWARRLMNIRSLKGIDSLYFGYVQWSRIVDRGIGSHRYFASIILVMQLYLNAFTLLLVARFVLGLGVIFNKALYLGAGVATLLVAQFVYVIPGRMRRLRDAEVFPEMIDRRAAYRSMVFFGLSLVICLLVGWLGFVLESSRQS